MPISFSEDICIDKLKYEPFKNDTHRVRNFNCGVKDLNDFLNSEEVVSYEEEHVGKTTLVFYDGELIAYYTVCIDTLRKEYVKSVKGFSKIGALHIEGIPAVTIGRLAVDKRWQNRGVGAVLTKRIAMNTADTAQKYGVRLLLVQAKKDAFDFYLKKGFDFVFESKRERQRFKDRGTRTMFFDLKTIMDLAEE
jgi:GNAT superfamily N-acetyltransferase